MSSPSLQYGLGPMALQSVKGADLSPLNSVKPVTLAELVVVAGSRLGMQKKEMAQLFELSPPDFSAAFDSNKSERNRLMKIHLPMELARQIAVQLCEATGLAIGGPDAQRHALADVLHACANYVRTVEK